MTIQPPGYAPAGPRTYGGPYGGTYGWPGTTGSVEDDWTTPLWGNPDTQATTWGPPPRDPGAPAPVPPPPGPPRRRALVAVLAAVLAVLLVAGVLVVRALAGGTDDTVAHRPTPLPSSQVTPTQPATPTPQPSPSQTGPGGQGLPGFGGQGSQGGTGSSTLTPAQQQAAAAVSPALVDIVTTLSSGAQGAGTGVVVSADGIVLTNHHVVAGATSIRVTDVGNGQTYSATVLGYDRSHDVAVIRLTGASGLTVAKLGDSSAVKVGDSVVAVGNGGGRGGTPSSVGGRVTGLDQSITAQDSANGTSEQLTGLIETDAAIVPGYSGGALADTNGAVVGIITAGAISGGGDGTATAGYAIPIATAQAITQQIQDGRSSDTVHVGATAYLGVQVSTARGTSATRGVVVSGVVPGGAAANAGITAGSTITALDGSQVASTDDLLSALDLHHPGDVVSVTWVDASGQQHTAKATLGKGPVG